RLDMQCGAVMSGPGFSKMIPRQSVLRTALLSPWGGIGRLARRLSLITIENLHMYAQKRLSPLLLLLLGISGSGIVFAAAPNDGLLDTSFSGNGKIAIPFDMGAADTDQGSDAVADNQGRTYIVGTVATDVGTRIGISRVNADGSIDHAYGEEQNGVVGP